MERPDLSQFSLLDLFCLEVKAQVATLNQALLALETHVDPVEPLASLMRAAHSIKGAARIVQVEAAVKVAHLMEECFVAVQAGTIELQADDIDALLQGADLLLALADSLTLNPDAVFSDHDPRIQAFVQAMTGILTAPPVRAADSIVVPSPDPVDPVVVAPTVATLPVESALLSSTPLASSSLPSVTERVVRVSADNLNRLMGLAGESLVEANWLQPFADSLLKLKTRQTELTHLLEKLQESLSQQSLTQQSTELFSAIQLKANECRQVLGERQSELEQFSRRSANLADRLYREVIASHMRPFGDGVQGFPRMVRDLAKQLGKQVKLEIVGKGTSVDRDILERLESPLTHLLRNAIDHGIETPEVRLAAGKPAIGTIRLEASHRAGMLLITVNDDGRGIDLELLRQDVVRKQLTTAAMAAQLTELELFDFLYLPGFSTAAQVTEISGRGVGLDVVHSIVQEMGGTLRTQAQAGQGMSFHLQLPLTLSVIRTLLVEIAGEPYAFPLTRIDQVVVLPQTDIQVAENCPYFLLDQQAIGLVTADQVLGLNAIPSRSEHLFVVVISDRLSRYGVIVDRSLGEQRLVVRPLDPRLGKVPNISAAALMDNAAPVLIVDVEDLVRSIDNLLASGQFSQMAPQVDAAIVLAHKHILVVDDSITVREMERKLLENRGYKVDVAVNGIDGWNALRTGSYNLVITDIDMPRMNGIELISQIRAHPELKTLPTIIVSYKDRETDRLQGLEVGADYYLTKSSFHDDTFLQAVIDLIGTA
ncbi:hybrid sensor histidine kinase/response regulator [Pantanalinema rosaneae CENA516]|uniref:hybrid sensor histidine kinase/response regulator n=1 Tax=Pantanalinema rosaneae TaxID=1620701 RepID=UPI003D6F3E40